MKVNTPLTPVMYIMLNYKYLEDLKNNTSKFAIIKVCFSVQNK